MKRSAIKQALVILIFFIVGFLIYSNTYDVPFYFDDKVRIADNPSIRLTALKLSNIKKAAFGELGAENRPIGNISFALNYFFSRYDLRSYHLTNIVIHILGGIFLYLVLKLTLDIYWH
jgi:protein O-mannosyl-transferase